MTNQTFNFAPTLDDLIAYATISYIIPTPIIDAEFIEQLDQIMPEMRDTLDDFLESFLPMNIADDLDDDTLMTYHAILDTMIDDPIFYSRLLDIALARMTR